MAFNIRNDVNIHGINVSINNVVKTIKLTQLADDTTLFLSSKNEIGIALKTIETFGKHSGLILNRNKTEGLWIGKLKLCLDKISDINWSNSPIKSLGVYFGCNTAQCNKLNWENKLRECENIIKQWNKRNLTFFGKIKVIKTLILSKFVYLVQSVKVPHDIIKKIDSLIYTFLWHGKREKIRRTTLIGQKFKGGIDMCDTTSFFKSLKMKFIQSLLKCEEANWKILPKYFLNGFGENFLIFKMNLDKLKHIENCKMSSIPEFYIDIIETWLEIKNVNKSQQINTRGVRKVMCIDVLFSNYWE
jgi:hypothetical protein